MLYATYNDKRWGLPPMTGSKADLAIATRLLSASDATDTAFFLGKPLVAQPSCVRCGQGNYTPPGRG